MFHILIWDRTISICSSQLNHGTSSVEQCIYIYQNITQLRNSKNSSTSKETCKEFQDGKSCLFPPDLSMKRARYLHLMKEWTIHLFTVLIMDATFINMRRSSYILHFSHFKLISNIPPFFNQTSLQERLLNTCFITELWVFQKTVLRGCTNSSLNEQMRLCRY